MSKAIYKLFYNIYVKGRLYEFKFFKLLKNFSKNIITRFVKIDESYKTSKEEEVDQRNKLLQPKEITSLESKFLEGFENIYDNEECVIIGNGPSLNFADLSKIDVPTFAVNSFFIKSKETGFYPTFYTLEDKHVVADNIEEIKNYNVKNKFIPSLYRELLGNIENNYYYYLDLSFYRDKPIQFSDNISKTIFAGQTVTYVNMQLAYYMGFKTVYLIGMDFNYIKPEGTLVNGNTWTSQGDDPNHFSKDYFSKGKKYHDPQLHKVQIAYEKAKEFYESNGRKIINLTHGGKLEVFPRDSFDNNFK